MAVFVNSSTPHVLEHRSPKLSRPQHLEVREVKHHEVSPSYSFLAKLPVPYLEKIGSRSFLGSAVTEMTKWLCYGVNIVDILITLK